MSGRPPKVNHVKKQFKLELAAARNLVSVIESLPRQTRNKNGNGIHPKHVNQVVELAFMGIVAAWEEFLERSLVRYLAGAKTDTNYSPTHKYGRANTISHAYEILSQDARYDPQKHYLKVSDPKWVLSTAEFYFSSHQYNCLQNNLDLLKKANLIRNRVAHGSDKCKKDFKDTAIWFLQPANDSLTQGFSPGSLLTKNVIRHFGAQVISLNKSHFSAYLDLYEQLSDTIIP